MKKGLSVLLIAAALFGFYGGAVNLNDVLACKDYWEEEGERSTADMNKLEDGLNQLKENEQAYLDGIDQIADGEIALAEGEAAFAEGQATLAQGEADYAAAPGKLAAARKKLAKGERDLAAGEKKLAAGKKAYAQGLQDYKDAPAKLKGVAALLAGIDTVINGYNKQYKPNFENLKTGRKQLYQGASPVKDNLISLAAFLDEGYQKTYVGAVNDVAGDDEKQSAKDYKDFIQSTNTLATLLPKIQEGVKAKSESADELYNNLSQLAAADPTTKEGQKDYVTFAGACAQYSSDMATLSDLDKVTDKFSSNVATLAKKYVAYNKESEALKPLQEAEATAKAAYEAEPTPENEDAFNKAVQEATEQGDKVKKAAGDAVTAVASNKETILDGMKQATDFLASVNEMVNGEDSAINTQLLPGLQKFNSAATDAAIDALVNGQDTLSDGVLQIAGGLQSALSDSDTRKKAEKALGKAKMAQLTQLLQVYSNDPNPLNSKLSDLDSFNTQMGYAPLNLVANLEAIKPLLRQLQADGQKSYDEAPGKLEEARSQIEAGEDELDAGRDKLTDGKRQYAQGLAEYKAAPAKLADGRAKLADAAQQLEDGRKELADGKEQLAEYEDGEQQVRDGLATLMGTTPDGGLTSILDRRNGDDDFDNGDNHLELDEGLEAVTVGRGYQADSGELITKEITGRAIGTAAGLGAGALAVLAAILSFLKKNKGAGVCAILAAAAGAAGIAYGTSAGMEFSNIAGSTVGSLPWVAAGVLAAVAAVHAIAHFASKEA